MYTGVHSDVARESGAHQTSTTLRSKSKFIDFYLAYYIVEPKLQSCGINFAIS